MHRPYWVTSNLQDGGAGKHRLVSWCVGVYTDMFECGECLRILCVIACESVFVLGPCQFHI